MNSSPSRKRTGDRSPAFHGEAFRTVELNKDLFPCGAVLIGTAPHSFSGARGGFLKDHAMIRAGDHPFC